MPADAPTMQRGELPRSYLAADTEGYPAKAVFGPIANMAEAEAGASA